MPKSIKRTHLLALFITLIAALGTALWQTVSAGLAVETFMATLDGAQEVPSVATTASGKAILVLDGDGTTLHYHLEVFDIDNITAAHIHDGDAGANGGVVVGLDAATLAPGTPASGTVTLTAEQVADLQASGYYINVHTSDVPSGEIRGQIMPHVFSVVGSVLSPANEVPAVMSDASGVIRFEQTAVDTYDYELAVNDIISVTAAHIHDGVAGVNGGVVAALNAAGLSDTTATSGSVTFASGESLFHFLVGAYYVNVHTTPNPGGELRGQTMAAPMLAYGGDALGANEVPAVMTDAEGEITLVVGSDWQSAFFRATVTDLTDITASHIHEAPAGSNGGVVFNLGSDYADDDAEGMLTFDILQLADLIAERLYLNIHTTANAGGELRAQLTALTPEADTFVLEGAQEVPAVTTDAAGNATIGFNGDNTISFNIVATEIVSVSAAHMHEGAAGSNGGVVFGFTLPTTRDGHETLTLIGTEPLTYEQMAELLSGEYYINIHTVANPGGELRGQLFDGAQEPSAVQLSAQSAEITPNMFIAILLVMTAITMLARRIAFAPNKGA